ncbi:MAG: CehA/McbA family metallohydrolase [Pirellulaceae bacterium]
MKLLVCWSRIVGLWLCGIVSLLSLVSGQEAQVVQEAVPTVDSQPLASNVRRLLQALESLGHPLPQERSRFIESALQAMDGASIQQAVDQASLATITISPEERVSVERGKAMAALQQAGYTPAILKVVNHSTATARLRITSPQAGPVYAGTAELSMQRQQQTGLLENQNVGKSNERFLAIEFYDSRPMTSQLSGLEVEYVLVLLAASEAGKREAVLHFDIGDGTADLEHRNELPILFEIQPAIPLELSIADENGAASIARLEFRDVDGRVYPLQAKRTAPDFFFQSHIYRRDGELVWLPHGHFSVYFSRGPEYRVQATAVDIVADRDNRLAIQLDRWFDAREFGFYSGDHHIHAAGCAHYTHPSEGVSPADMFRQVQGEGLNVGCVLTWGPCFEHQRQYFGAQADLFGTRDTLLKYDLEISGFGSQALGHVCLLNLSEQSYPGSEGSKTKGWPTWTTPVMRWAKEQGGYAGYAHSASGLAIDPASASRRLMQQHDVNRDGALQMDEVGAALLPLAAADMDLDGDQRISLSELQSAHDRAAEELPNYAIPEMNGVGAMEICVSTVAGVCDFISAMDTGRIQEWNTWYHLLNCGFPLKVSGETDFPCMSSRRVGKGRVYVHLGTDVDALDFGAWCRGLAEGRSYVSDGYAHLPSFTVDGVAPGYGNVQMVDAGGTVHVSAQVAFAPKTPAGVAYGTLDSAEGRSVIGDTVILHRERSEDWVAGGQRKVEIVVNGQVVSEHVISADGEVHAVEATIPIEVSSWVAVRHFPQMHSNPVYVIVNQAPVRASRDSARWCIEMTKLLWENREKNIAPAERPAARAAFDMTFDTLEQIADESPANR